MVNRFFFRFYIIKSKWIQIEVNTIWQSIEKELSGERLLSVEYSVGDWTVWQRKPIGSSSDLNVKRQTGNVVALLSKMFNRTVAFRTFLSRPFRTSLTASFMTDLMVLNHFFKVTFGNTGVDSPWQGTAKDKQFQSFKKKNNKAQQKDPWYQSWIFVP